MFVYRNSNTGDQVEYEHRSPRLDMLPNWALLDNPEESRVIPEQEAQVGEALPELPQDAFLEDARRLRPARSAAKADWVAYARALAKDSAEESEIDGLTKEQLIDTYGGDS
ncbi:hypothetical protein [Streptomyces sp. PR69]|uniref:hypothetical protein n=1 Tax=Streptomyces sp. PR69 TaxID=2984950 RepID=UPI0022651B9B|nr:hypothetical protein [Streptomyces sp. PR69]